MSYQSANLIKTSSQDKTKLPQTAKKRELHKKQSDYNYNNKITLKP